MTSSADTRHVTRSPADTRALAAKLTAQCSGTTTVLALYGDLGSGKTCFVQGMADALGMTVPVTSPTFTLVNEYAGPAQPLIHIDLYRLHNADEALAMGFEEYLESGDMVAIEWPERAEDLLPAHTLRLHFRALQEPSHREIRITYPFRD